MALRALSDLRSGAKNVYLVTLATAFLKVHPTWGGPAFSSYLFAVFLGMVCVSAVLFKFVFHGSEPDLLLAAIIVFLVSAGSSFAIVKFLINPKPMRIYESIQNAWPGRPFHLAEAAHYVQPQLKMLVIRGVGDEASLALAAGKIGNKLSQFMLEASSTALPITLLRNLLTAPSMLLLMVATLFLEFQAWHLILYSPLILTLVFGLAPSVFKSFFGREFFLGCSRCEIEVDSVPDCKYAAIVTLAVSPFPEADRNRRGHSIYQHPECVPTIADWLDELGLLGRKPLLPKEETPSE